VKPNASDSTAVNRAQRQRGNLQASRKLWIRLLSKTVFLRGSQHKIPANFFNNSSNRIMVTNGDAIGASVATVSRWMVSIVIGAMRIARTMS
jgi:hypothetical protein